LSLTYSMLFLNLALEPTAGQFGTSTHISLAVHGSKGEPLAPPHLWSRVVQGEPMGGHGAPASSRAGLGVRAHPTGPGQEEYQWGPDSAHEPRCRTGLTSILSLRQTLTSVPSHAHPLTELPEQAWVPPPGRAHEPVAAHSPNGEKVSRRKAHVSGCGQSAVEWQERPKLHVTLPLSAQTQSGLSHWTPRVHDAPGPGPGAGHRWTPLSVAPLPPSGPPLPGIVVGGLGLLPELGGLLPLLLPPVVVVLPEVGAVLPLLVVEPPLAPLPELSGVPPSALEATAAV
jgi:hypothetical protein